MDSQEHTILLAEDNAILQLLVARVLRTAGYTVITAGDGAEALVLARCFLREIEMLVTDLHLPRINGLDLASAVERDRPGVKVLLVSSEPPSALPLRWAFLAKPFLVGDLLAMVITVLESPAGALPVQVGHTIAT